MSIASPSSKEGASRAALAGFGWPSPPSIGFLPAVLALSLYSVLPTLRKTVTGIEGVAPALSKAARGVGLNPQEVLWQVELPLDRPTLVAGIRTATVWVVGWRPLQQPPPVTAWAIRFSLVYGRETYRWYWMEVCPMRFTENASCRRFSGAYWSGNPVSRFGGFLLSGRRWRSTRLVAGELDLYGDYSGTVYATILERETVGVARAEVLREERTALRDDLDFFERSEWNALESRYALSFGEERAMDSSPMYGAEGSLRTLW